VAAADSKKKGMSDELLALEADVFVNLIRLLAEHEEIAGRYRLRITMKLVKLE
jgi:hypothetical protein